MKDGLSSRRVLSIRQSNQGYMWILTHKGIDRYDGKNFKHYQVVKDNSTVNFYPNLNQLAIDEENTLWELGKDGYIFRYDEMKDSFRLMFDMRATYPQYKDRPVSALYFGENAILMYCGKDLIKYYPEEDSTSCTTNVADEYISCISEGKDKEEYFLASKRNIYNIIFSNDGKHEVKETGIGDIGIIDYIFYHKERFFRKYHHDIFLHTPVNF